MVFPLFYVGQKFKDKPVLLTFVVVAFVRNQKDIFSLPQFSQNLPCQLIAGGINYINHILTVGCAFETGAAQTDAASDGRLDLRLVCKMLL